MSGIRNPFDGTEYEIRFHVKFFDRPSQWRPMKERVTARTRNDAIDSIKAKYAGGAEVRVIGCSEVHQQPALRKPKTREELKIYPFEETPKSTYRPKPQTWTEVKEHHKIDAEQAEPLAKEYLTPDEYAQYLENKARDNEYAIRHELINRTPVRDLHKIPGAWKHVRDQEKAQVNTGSILTDIAKRAGIGLRHRIRNKFYKTLDKYDQKYNLSHPERNASEESQFKRIGLALLLFILLTVSIILILVISSS
ncbi:MAG: hypothetical protein JNL45_11040 [Hyphomicrobium sp.]|nr:hypothetical protein [Hyphomicrobium sp.]